MKRYAYMNEAIRDPEPSKPVIVVQTGKRIQITNRVQLVVAGKVIGEIRFLKEDLKAAPHHRVRAFIEFFAGVDLVVES